MNILLSNDDGVDALGINILKNHLKQDHNVLVCAPHKERSTTGHTLTLRKNIPFILLDEKTISCEGYPADCVMLGLNYFKNSFPIDLVISGINHGANLAQDIFYSGTVAAAREACMRNIPAIAMSLVLDGIDHLVTNEDSTKLNFESSLQVISLLIENNISKILGPYYFLNINSPNIKKENVKGIKLGHPGMRIYAEKIKINKELDFSNSFYIGGEYSHFLTKQNNDAEIIDEGKISLSLLNIFEDKSEITNQISASLKGILEKWPKRNSAF